MLGTGKYTVDNKTWIYYFPSLTHPVPWYAVGRDRVDMWMHSNRAI
jgi:hypothetical protein